MSIIGLQGFMGKVSKKDDSYDLWENYCYIAVTEWGWNEEEIHEASIPFVLQLLSKRHEVKKAEEAAARKR